MDLLSFEVSTPTPTLTLNLDLDLSVAGDAAVWENEPTQDSCRRKNEDQRAAEI